MDKAMALANQTLAVDPENVDVLSAVIDIIFSRTKITEGGFLYGPHD